MNRYEIKVSQVGNEITIKINDNHTSTCDPHCELNMYQPNGIVQENNSIEYKKYEAEVQLCRVFEANKDVTYGIIILPSGDTYARAQKTRIYSQYSDYRIDWSDGAGRPIDYPPHMIETIQMRDGS